ncbi:hypothetical protein [Streptomyces sp. NPDC001820]|uniref:hypothetical protein n=1 Tax=Streptomyces sp. NPDC001820 TaxID=3364613 RepID=UPI00367B9BB4
MPGIPSDGLPGGDADRVGVGVAVEYGPDGVQFAAAGVAVLAEVAVHAQEFHVRE